MTKVAIITTLKHNVGDDFVREGIIYLLGQILGKSEVSLIHKHLPITARPECDWLHSLGVDRALDRFSRGLSLRSTRQLDDTLPLFPTTDKIRTCDILVQSGAPVYWINKDSDCAHHEWWRPLIERRWIPYNGNRPFLNLAGGTCQHWASDGSEFSEREDVLEYIRHFFDLTKLTTLRDELSAKVLELAGRRAEVLPCTSIFAVDEFGITPSEGEYVALNYMGGGGHYPLGQPIDAQGWEQRFVEFARRLGARTRCVLVCHDEKEVAAAKRLLPEIERFYSTDHADYLRFYARARWGVLNRVHGVFALASLGKPAAVVGSDGRAKMVSLLGLPAVFVNEASSEWLENQASQLEALTSTYPNHMRELKRQTKARYLELLGQALRSGHHNQ